MVKPEDLWSVEASTYVYPPSKNITIKNIGMIDCPQCGNAVEESEIIWLNYEERIPDCCFDCENLARRGM